VVQGGPDNDQLYFKVSDLSKDVKNSVVLTNAYRLCIHSKNYKICDENQFSQQKFKSYIYINENMHKLTKKKMDNLLTNNYLLP
jgi:hypothetical protein